MDSMKWVFKPYLDKFVVVFINDILVYSKSKEEHVEHLCTVLKTLEEYKLYAKFKKCELSLEKVHFLGHVIHKEGASVDLAKAKAIVNWPKPMNITKVQSFLRMTSYY